jgi:hypothetical protein
MHRHGAYLTKGWGGAQDENGALEVYARACVLGHVPSCKPANARANVTNGRFSVEARARARKTLDDGCKAGVAEACFEK